MGPGESIMSYNLSLNSPANRQLFCSFQAALSVYNVLYAMNELNNVDLFEKAYFKQYSQLISQLSS